MIVLLDTKTLTIKIYSESGMKSISFDQVDLLKTMLKNNKIIYVTNVIITDVDSIIQTVNSLSQQRSERLKKAGEPMFLRSTLPGPLNIPGIRNKTTGKKEALSFFGPFDGKLLDEIARDFGKDVFKTNSTLRKLLQSGKLQILGESEFEDQEMRFKNGELKIRNLASDYIKYMKLLSKEESENEIAFDITRSTKQLAERGGPVLTGRENNESGFII